MDFKMKKCFICCNNNANSYVTFDNGREMYLCNRCIQNQTVRKIVKNEPIFEEIGMSTDVDELINELDEIVDENDTTKTLDAEEIIEDDEVLDVEETKEPLDINDFQEVKLEEFDYEPIDLNPLSLSNYDRL